MEQKLQNAVEDMIGGVDKSFLRRMRKDAFLCNAKCCDTEGSHEQVQNCVATCERKIVAAEQALTQELQVFQQRLQRCTYSCQDEVESQAAPNMDAATKSKLQSKYDSCCLKCVDESIASLGPMKKRIESSLSSLS